MRSAAAAVNDIEGGIGTTHSAPDRDLLRERAADGRSGAPVVSAATRSPGARPVTPSPTASTVPASSSPGVKGTAGRSW